MTKFASSSSAILLVVCGAINALLSKIVYQLEAPDCKGNVKPFEKPWLQTALMFVAMALCLPIAWLQQHWKARRKQQRQQHKQADAEDSGDAHDVEAQHSASSAAAASAAVLKAAAINALAAASTGGAAADAPSGSTATDGDLREPLLTNRQLQQHSQHVDRLVQGQHGGSGVSGRDNSNNTGNRSGNGGSSRKMSKMQEALLLCVPTGFDLAATTLMNVGLLYVAASVFQILRGAEMVFAALFAVIFLHRPLNRWHYMGVALCMGGIGCVGASRVLAGDSSGGDAAAAPAATAWMPLGQVLQGSSWAGRGGVDGGHLNGGGAPSGDSKMALLGMGLILLSQAIQAGQVTVEDHLMSDMDIDPLLVVGWEGLIGSLVMLGGALPLLQRLPYRDGSGFAEDTLGSLCMIRNSVAIAGALGLSTFAVLLYNIFGMFVTEDVGAAARTVLENARTLLVWLADLALYYTHVGGGKVGEPWDQWSWLQAVGFAVFAAGAYFYSKGHKKLEEEEAAVGKMPAYSKWAVLKSTLSIQTGHLVAARRFRVAGRAVLAGVRLANGLGRISEWPDE